MPPDRRSRDLLPPYALAAFVVAFVASGTIGLLSYNDFESRSEAAELIRQAKQVEHQIYLVQGDVIDAETGQRGFLLTGRESYILPFEKACAALPGDLLVLREITLGNRDQQLTIGMVSTLIQGNIDELADTIRHKRAGDTAGALEIVLTDRGKNYTDKIRDLVATMIGNEQKLLAVHNAEWTSIGTRSAIVVLGGVALLLLILGFIAVLTSRGYRLVSAEAWTRRLQVDIGERMQGDVRFESLGEEILTTLSERVDARHGAVYVREDASLRRIASHALPAEVASMSKISVGEGLTGEVAKSGELVHLRQLPASYLGDKSAANDGKSRELVILPAAVDGHVHAVTELAFTHVLDEVEVNALQRVSEVIAVALRTAKSRQRLEELLEETQRQAEELEAQREELRVSNEELEQQSGVLEVSQSQLETQQSVLEETNAQLEDQTRSLARQRDDLRRTGNELQRANEYKSQFLANMSHELRTPLNSSLILAKLLADNRSKNLTDEQIKFAQTIYSAGNDLLTLINDILDLSKIEAGMIEVRPELVTVRSMINELRAGFQPVATQRGLSLDFVIGDGVVSIESDPTRLNQVIKNLMSNALKFTEHGGVTMTIDKVGDELVFAVRDTGIGIPLDQHEHIFEAFRQVDAATTRKFGGSGLGLSISRELAHLLGGDLRVASEPGRGSTFALSLPIAFAGRATTDAAVSNRASENPLTTSSASPMRAAARELDSEPDRERQLPDAGELDAVFEGRKILIAEDDARNIFALTAVLEPKGAKIQIARNGREALAALDADPAIELVLMDVMMPVMDGLDATRLLRKDPRFATLPIIALTAKAMRDDRERCIEAGVNDYIAKPLNIDKLLASARAWIRK